MVLVSTGGQAKMSWHPFGASALNNCVNSRYNSVIASCHYGTLPTPSSWWVHTQRKTYKLYQEENSNSMTDEHIRALDGIGFDWGQAKLSWPKLGQWVSTQRSNYRLYQEGKPSRTTAERIRKLESLEFKWERNCVFLERTISCVNTRREKNNYKSCILSTEFNRSPNLVRDKGIYFTRAGSILTSARPAWDFGVQLH
jgi:hypothetical protein